MPIEHHHTSPFMSHFDLFDRGFNQLFRDIDRAFNDTFDAFDNAVIAFDNAFVPFHKHTFQHTHSQENGGYKCFMRRIAQTDQLPPRLQKTMLAIGRSVCEWEGNSEFKTSFDSYFRKLEQYENTHRRRPQAFANIKAGRTLVAQAAASYDSLAALSKEMRAKQNALKLQAPSGQRDSRLHILSEIEQALDQCVLPKELTEVTVATYTAHAQDLTTALKQRLEAEVGEVEYQPRQDVHATCSIAKSHLSKTSAPKSSTHATHPHASAASTVAQADLTAQKDELIKTIDNAIAEHHAFFEQTRADGIRLQNFEDLCHLRIGFWETQKALAKQCFTLDQVLHWQAGIEEARAVDCELFKQLNLACSYAHAAHPKYAGNLSLAGHIAEELMRDIASVNPHEKEKVGEFVFSPVSFGQLSSLVKESPAAPALKARLGALEALLLADRRSNTLLLETLAQEQRFFAQTGSTEIAADYDAIIGTYKALLDEGQPRANLRPEALQLFIARWNAVRAGAEAKRDRFRATLNN